MSISLICCRFTTDSHDFEVESKMIWFDGRVVFIKHLHIGDEMDHGEIQIVCARIV